MPEKNGKAYELQLLARMKQDCEESFSILFNIYYRDLVLYAGSIIYDRFVCEDIAQNILLKLWNDRHSLFIETSLKSYLLRSVKNSCLDKIRHQKIVDNHAAAMTFTRFSENETENYILHSDLQEQLEKAIEKLPEKYKEIFILSREKELKYKEIAEELNISVRTVEDRMSKALAQLRILLKDFLITYILIFFNL
ncbi:MAG: RNA polymerase sigma-70 factor [Dysgonomonas sp.]|nr:RNA polymerase sigma-70 factor [Dysgonomonas sp.]